MKERIRITAKALVETHIEVEGETADERRDEAERIARSGDCTWLYDGVESSSVEAQ